MNKLMEVNSSEFRFSASAFEGVFQSLMRKQQKMEQSNLPSLLGIVKQQEPYFCVRSPNFELFFPYTSFPVK